MKWGEKIWESKFIQTMFASWKLPVCPCESINSTLEHVIQECPAYLNLLYHTLAGLICNWGWNCGGADVEAWSRTVDFNLEQGSGFSLTKNLKKKF